MAFKKMIKNKYPPRLWALRGYPGSGKSTFAAQMRAPMVVIDADNRFEEVLHLVQGEVYELGDHAGDQTDTRRVSDLLDSNMPGSNVATIVVDSLTTIIAPLVTKAIQANDAGENKNRMAAFKDKALAMRQLQDSITRWGTDILVIYHLSDARDGQAREVTRPSISDTELARLMRSLNLTLEMVADRGRRGVKVVWARRGRSGMVLWDDTGCWRGMPELIEQAVYDGLTEDERAQLERGEVAVFPSPEVALAWAMERGAFEDEVHARNAYDKLKRERSPKSAYEMAALWIGEVQARSATPEVPAASAQASAPTPAPDIDPLDAVFPRDENGAPVEQLSLIPESEPEPTGAPTSQVSSVIGVNEFWKEFHHLDRAGKLPPNLRESPEIAEAKDTGNWDAALKWLHGQMRV